MLVRMGKTEKAVGAGCAAVVLMHLFASFFPESRLWGLNYFFYFAVCVRCAFLLMGLLFLDPDSLGTFVYHPLSISKLFCGKVYPAIRKPVASGQGEKRIWS
jgi:hypothetical protein